MFSSKNRTERMLRQIETEAKLTAAFTGRKKFSPQVLQAMAEVPREKFVSLNLKPFAYDNGPLPIGHGQTISQPYIVALMTDLLAPTPESRVLEIGTGSGYQAAILSRLVKKVYSVETIEKLVALAQQRFNELGYLNIETHCHDGYYGWPEKAPFDGIIVTAAAPHIPPPLEQQLKPGGKLVIPVGIPHGAQQLKLISKNSNDLTRCDDILDVAFVPLVSEPDKQQTTNYSINSTE